MILDIKRVDTLDRWLGMCERVFHMVANICFGLMLVLSAVNMTLRIIVGKAPIWMYPWTELLFVWTTFFGFFVVYRQRRDVRVDFLVDRLGPRAAVASRLLANAVGILLMVVILWSAPRIIHQQVGEIEFIGLERYFKSLPLFMSSMLVLVVALLDTICALAGRPEPRGHHRLEEIDDQADVRTAQ